MRFISCCLAISTGVAAVSSASAQRVVSPELALGTAIPTGPLGAHHDAGRLLRAGVFIGPRDSPGRLYLGLEDVRFGEEVRLPPGVSARGALRMTSALANLTFGPTSTPVAPYVLVGLAAHRMTIVGSVNPYGTVIGARAGVGLRLDTPQLSARIEVASHVIASDYATGKDFSFGRYVPVILGLSF